MDRTRTGLASASLRWRAEAVKRVAVLVLVFLSSCQAVASAGASFAHSVSSPAFHSQNCEAPDNSPHPAKDSCRHAQCCVLCGQGWNSFAALHVVVSAVPTPFGARPEGLDSGSSPGAPATPPGWRSGWSSRSPPACA